MDSGVFYYYLLFIIYLFILINFLPAMSKFIMDVGKFLRLNFELTFFFH